MSEPEVLARGDGDALDALPVYTHIEHNGVRYIKDVDGWSLGSWHRYGAELAMSGPSTVLYRPDAPRS